MMPEDDDYRKIMDAAVSRPVEKFLSSLRKYQDHALEPEYLNDPIKHWSLQKALLQRIEGGDEAVTTGRRLAKESGRDDVANQAEANHLLSRAHREIADGFAWRTLGFNRSKLRILAQGQGAGFVSSPAEGAKSGRRGEEKLALNVLSHGQRALLHDITNFLRIGDVSLVTDKGAIYLADSKKKGKRTLTPAAIAEKIVKGQLTNAQSERLLEAQLAIDGKEMTTSKGTYPIWNLSVAPRHFMPEVAKLLDEASKEGYASGYLADYLHLEITHLPAMLNNPDKLLNEEPDCPDGELAGMFSSYDPLHAHLGGELFRNKAPYSVYPFSSKHVVDIITGRTHLRSYLLKEPLERELKERGWTIHFHLPDNMPTDDEWAATVSSRRLFSDNFEQPFVGLSDGSGFGTRLPLEMFSRIESEFVSLDYILDLVLALKKDFKPGDSGGGWPGNEREAEMWQ